MTSSTPPATARATTPSLTSETEAEIRRYARGRVPREVRLRHVLAVAEELFVERGYQQTSMDELARRADVSKPVVYDLVGSKEQLFATLMELWADELASRIAGAVGAVSDPEEWLHAGAAAFFGFVEEHRAAWGALLSGDDAPVTSAFAAARARQARLVADLVSRAADEGGDPVDPVIADALAHAVNGAFEALARWWPAHPELAVDQLAGLVVALVGPGLSALGRP